MIKKVIILLIDYYCIIILIILLLILKRILRLDRTFFRPFKIGKNLGLCFCFQFLLVSIHEFYQIWFIEFQFSNSSRFPRHSLSRYPEKKKIEFSICLWSQKERKRNVQERNSKMFRFEQEKIRKRVWFVKWFSFR